MLEALRVAGVRRIDVVVATDGDRADADAVVAIQTRYDPIEVMAPPLHRVPGGRSIHPGTIVRAGDLVVAVRSEGDVHQLVVGDCAMPPCQDGGP